MYSVKKVSKLNQETIVNEVNEILHTFCINKIARAKEYDSSYENMWKIIDAYLMEGGKRIRPYLTLLAYKAYGGKDLTKVYPAACAWELLHAGLLVHDDIIDRDTIRHGALNIAGTYQKMYGESTDDSEHFASSSALLAGDLLLAGAQEIVLNSALPAQEKTQVCTYLIDALFCVGGGELLDIETILEPIAKSSPEKIAKYKTAGYSFEYPLLCGAFLAGASESNLELLQLFGKNVGIIFQLIDDILGVFGDTNKTGKPNDSDIREKKRTALIKATLGNLNDKDKLYLEMLFSYSHELTSKEISEVHNFIDKTGAKEIVLSQAKSFAKTASDIVTNLSIDSSYRQQLQALVDRLLIRLV